MGTDTSKLYAQHAAMNRQNHFNLMASPRPHSHMQSVPKSILQIPSATPLKDKIQTGNKDSQVSQITPFQPYNSYIGNNFFKQQGPRGNLQRSKSLTANNPLNFSQITPGYFPKEARVFPSILKKQSEKGFEKMLKIDPYHEEIDAIRVSLRSSKDKIIVQMKPMILHEIGQMNVAIEGQKTNGLSNKGKILFILAQKSHYQNLIDKLQEYQSKINAIINILRRHDTLPYKNIQQMNVTKDSIARLLNNVEKDLPNKSWKVVIQQPDSKLYQLVVMKANKSEQIKKQLTDLEKADKSQTSSILNGSMLFSNTYRVNSPNPLLQNSTNQFKNVSNVSSNISNNSSINFPSHKLQSSVNLQEPFYLMKKNSSGSENMNPYPSKGQVPMRQTRYPFGQVNKL